MNEEWRPVAGFSDYEVSSLGRVRSLKRKGMPTHDPNGILHPWPHSFGYPMVTLYRDGRAHKLTVHGLVCAAFHGPPRSPRHQAAHGDGVPTNVRADNLRWALPVENNADKIRHGTHFNSGQFQPQLSDDEVREIRRLLAEGWTQSRIAAKFGIRQTMVSHIKTGKRWAHVK